jgi:hypothetical protein
MTLLRIVIAGACLLCFPSHASFFASCQRAIRSFLPWAGISTEGLQFRWIERERSDELLKSLEKHTLAAMNAGLAPSDAFRYAHRLSARWLEENPVEPGTAIFAAPRSHEWMVALDSDPLDYLRRRPGKAHDMSSQLRVEFTPRVMGHFLRGSGIPYATERAASLLAKYSKVRRTYYTTVQHLPVPAAVEFSSGEGPDLTDPLHHLLLTSPENISVILEDVSKRLETLREIPHTSENLDQRLEVFTIAVYGYYQAYPFERGTHPLGHSLFRGFFSSLFGHDLQQWPPEGRILESLGGSQGRFVELWMPFFKGSLIGSHP